MAVRTADITVERILELKAKGLRALEISQRLGCTRQMIYQRLSGRKKKKKIPDSPVRPQSMEDHSEGLERGL